jgi:hypothetical protein
VKTCNTVSVAAWAETVAAKPPASTKPAMRVENSDIVIPLSSGLPAASSALNAPEPQVQSTQSEQPD